MSEDSYKRASDYYNEVRAIKTARQVPIILAGFKSDLNDEREVNDVSRVDSETTSLNHTRCLRQYLRLLPTITT